MFPVFLLFFKYLPFAEEPKGKSDLFGGILKDTYHDEAAVIESQLELEVSLFVLWKIQLNLVASFLQVFLEII